MNEDFLTKLRPQLGPVGLERLQEADIALAGLGGNGCWAFEALLRMGVRRFRIADDGIFNLADINRQLGAFNSTMDRHKLDVYSSFAKDINSEVELQIFKEGLTLENLDRFVEGSTLFIRHFDHDKGFTLDRAIPAVLKKYDIPCFSSFLFGFGTLMFNFRPNDVSLIELFNMITSGSSPHMIGELVPLIATQFFSQPLMKRFTDHLEATGVFASTVVGGQLAGLLVASEVCNYLWQGTDLATREVVWSPQFVALDFLTLDLQTRDVRELGF